MIKLRYLALCTTILTLAACSNTQNDEHSKVTDSDPVSKVTTAPAEKVEIVLTDKLDGILSNFCIDIAGGNKNVDTSKGLQTHTCYSYKGSLGTDQIFSTSKFSDNILYMPEYDVCATVADFTAGSKVGLAACDGSDQQRVKFSGAGTITLMSMPNLCFTAAKDTRFGKGSQHQIKALTLEACSEELSAFQQWRVRSTED